VRERETEAGTEVDGEAETEGGVEEETKEGAEAKAVVDEGVESGTEVDVVVEVEGEVEAENGAVQVGGAEAGPHRRSSPRPQSSTSPTAGPKGSEVSHSLAGNSLVEWLPASFQ
jgi:hypothetical protein